MHKVSNTLLSKFSRNTLKPVEVIVIFASAQAIQTILDKSPWDSLKIWHVFANRSIFDALEGRVCAKWRPPPPWSMLLRKSALSAHWYNIERGGGGGRGKSKRGDFQRKSACVPTLLSRIVVQLKQITNQRPRPRSLVVSYWRGNRGVE